MSTVGKVLVVLVGLALIPWAILFSLVYQLNENWGQQIQNLDKKIAATEQDTTKIRAEIDALLKQVDRSQRDRDNQLTVLRERLSDTEKQQTLATEAQERIRLQIETLNVSLQSAQSAVEHRTQELQGVNQSLADTRAAVQVLRQDVDAKFKQVTDLRDRFLKTMAENRKQLNERWGDDGSGGPPRVRSASLQ